MSRIIYKSIIFVAFISATTNANNAKNLFSSSYHKDHLGTRTQEWASTTTKSVLNNQSIAQSSQRASLTPNSSAKQAAALPIQQGESTIHSPFSFKQGGMYGVITKQIHFSNKFKFITHYTLCICRRNFRTPGNIEQRGKTLSGGEIFFMGGPWGPNSPQKQKKLGGKNFFSKGPPFGFSENVLIILMF